MYDPSGAPMLATPNCELEHGCLSSFPVLLPWFPTTEERSLILHYCANAADLMMAIPSSFSQSEETAVLYIGKESLSFANRIREEEGVRGRKLRWGIAHGLLLLILRLLLLARLNALLGLVCGLSLVCGLILTRCNGRRRRGGWSTTTR